MTLSILFPFIHNGRQDYQNQLLQLEDRAAVDCTSAGLAWAHKETEVNVDKEVGVWIVL